MLAVERSQRATGDGFPRRRRKLIQRMHMSTDSERDTERTSSKTPAATSSPTKATS
ncbi:hypothetical protein R8510_05310 [Ralstonia chuxiongensis]|nr:hypothetical protein R8510_05310 [Ralstonia chuxiongensis]